MTSPLTRAITLVPVAVLLLGAGLAAQSVDAPSVEAVVEAGRPLRVALDGRVRVRAVGQRVSGTLLEPVYSRDHIVIPAGATVLGRIAALEPEPRALRVEGLLSGNFSPKHGIVLQFDHVLLADGSSRPIQTIVGQPTEHLTIRFAASEKPEDDDAGHGEGAGERAREAIRNGRDQAMQKARDAVALVKQPGKLERLKAAAIDRLPYHPQFLPAGAVYDAKLEAPLDFGSAVPIRPAPPGTPPAPESVLSARMVTEVNSAKSAKGSSVAAVLTEPVLSAQGDLILPEGTELRGAVTFVRKARRFHRNGQLRFLFESVRVPGAEPTTLLASLYSVQVSEDERIAVDEEGGTRATNTKTRFIAPALALMSMRSLLDKHEHRLDGDADDSLPARPAGNPAARGMGGFFGWGLAGTAAGLVSRPVGVALAAIGAARSVYGAVFGRGRDVVFPVDTPIQVQLAPGPSRPAR